MELLDLHRVLFSRAAAGERGDERVHHRRERRGAFAEPGSLAFRVGWHARGGRRAEYHWIEHRQMAAECGRRIHVLTAAGAAGHRGNSVDEARTRNTVHAGQHAPALDFRPRELLLPHSFSIYLPRSP